MVDVPSIDDAKDKVGNAARNTIASLFLLDSPIQCKQCGATTEPSQAYDPQEAAFYAETNGERPTWYCEACDQHYRRVE